MDDATVDDAGADVAAAEEAAEVAGVVAAAEVAAEVADGDGEDEPVLFDELLHPTSASEAAVTAVIPIMKRRAMATAFCVPCLNVRPRVSGGY